MAINVVPSEDAEETSVLSRLDNIAISCLHELEEVDAAREQEVREHKDRMARLNNHAQRLRKLLRAIGQEPPSPSTKKQQKQPGSKSRISQASLQILINAILARGEDEMFTQPELGEEIGWDQTKISRAFRYLRSMEILAKLGPSPENPRRVLWTVMDRDALEKLND